MLEELVWSRGHNIVLLPGQTSVDRWDCAFIPSSSEQYLEGSDGCAWQPEGILDISFHVSVFLLSLPWARLCLWSWSLARTRCYVGFYGGKKKHTGCQTWKSIKKGEEGSGGRVVRGVWGGEEM